MNRQLRERLACITRELAPDEHPAEIERLREEIAHSIELLEGAAPISDYTCAVHAFDLIQDPTYESVATFGLCKTFAGKEFIHFLLDQELLEERALDDRAGGRLLMYFEGGDFQHIGTLLAENRLVSKWGMGHLWEHGIWEVPANYGDELRLFEAPADGAGLDLFIEYAKAEGFEFRDDDA